MSAWQILYDGRLDVTYQSWWFLGVGAASWTMDIGNLGHWKSKDGKKQYKHCST